MALVTVRRKNNKLIDEPLYFVCDTCLCRFASTWPRVEDGNISNISANDPYFDYCPKCGTPAVEFVDDEKERTVFFTFYPTDYKVGEVIKSNNYFRRLNDRPDVDEDVIDYKIVEISYRETFKIKNDFNNSEPEEAHLYEVICRVVSSS